MTLEISADGFFLVEPPGAGRTLTVIGADRTVDVQQIAAAGAWGVALEWPSTPALLEAAHAARLGVVARVARQQTGRRSGRSRATALASSRLATAVDLWVLPEEAGAGRLAAALCSAQRSLVAGPVLDPRIGSCAGQAATTSTRGVADLLDQQLAARRRPLVAHCGIHHQQAIVAADLGAACVVFGARGGVPAAAALVESLDRRLEAAPAISVVVCAYNAERELPACLRSLAEQCYPRFEVIVVDDGSDDSTPRIGRDHGTRVVEMPRRGISAARNAGVSAAEGEIVAFLDADEEAPAHWLEMLWRGMEACGADAVTGPNLPFPGDGLQARVVSALPGAAVPVVRAGGQAEHLTSCNMAARRRLLEETPFDERRAAGEDVAFSFDARDAGAKLFYLPTAAVWHHRRPTLGGFLRQQLSYGEAVSEDLESRFTAPAPARRVSPLGRPVFAGSEAAQLFAHQDYPSVSGLPPRAVAAVLTASTLSLPWAVATGSVRRWSVCLVASLSAILVWVAVRVPVFAARPGATGLWQRLLTAALWLLRPAAYRIGLARGRRRRASGRARDPVTDPHR